MDWWIDGFGFLLIIFISVIYFVCFFVFVFVVFIVEYRLMFSNFDIDNRYLI